VGSLCCIMGVRRASWGGGQGAVGSGIGCHWRWWGWWGSFIKEMTRSDEHMGV
jgi:hypothetical protein